jgi:hypothetical protein
VAEGQAVGVLSVSAAADVAFGPVVLRVRGQGQGPEGPISVPAAKLLTFAQLTGAQGMIPTNTESQTGLPAAPSQPQAGGAECPETPIEVAHGYGATVPVKVTRTMGSDAALTVNHAPPAGPGPPRRAHRREGRRGERGRSPPRRRRRWAR